MDKEGSGNGEVIICDAHDSEALQALIVNDKAQDHRRGLY
jgi:hypothetical protein